MLTVFVCLITLMFFVFCLLCFVASLHPLDLFFSALLSLLLLFLLFSCGFHVAFVVSFACVFIVLEGA